jgi:hypothetical protein
MHTDTVTRIDQSLVHAAGVLRERAESLRVQAGQLTAPLQRAYRRRASELEFEAFLLEVQSGLPYEQIHSAA